MDDLLGERSWQVVEQELTGLLARVEVGQFRRFAQAFADRTVRRFFSGQGRSGLIAQVVAMRLMHAGYAVHVVGEASAPAISRGDMLGLKPNQPLEVWRLS